MTDQLTTSPPELLQSSWLWERRRRRMAASLHSRLHHVLQLQRLFGEKSKMISVCVIFLGMNSRKMTDTWNANGNGWRAWSYSGRRHGKLWMIRVDRIPIMLCDWYSFLLCLESSVCCLFVWLWCHIMRLWRCMARCLSLRVTVCMHDMRDYHHGLLSFVDPSYRTRSDRLCSSYFRHVNC